MDLIPIKDYEGFYSYNKNTNQIWGHYRKKYLKPVKQKNGYYNITLRKKTINKSIGFHRLIYLIHNPDIDMSNLVIDHIDGNISNNNIENLRLCSQSQNACNTRRPKKNKLGYQNIRECSGKYRVEIVKNRTLYNKRFDTLEEAIKHRDIKLVELQGEFSKIYN